MLSTSEQLHRSAEWTAAAFVRAVRPDLFPDGDEDDIAVHDTRCYRCRAIRRNTGDVHTPRRARCDACVGVEVAARRERVYVGSTQVLNPDA
jgi:hypothetical protein